MGCCLGVLILLCIIGAGISYINCLEETRMQKQAENRMEKIENVYRIGVSQYLSDTLSLKEYDQKLTSSDMRFVQNDEEHLSEAQKNDKLGLRFIYLRNNVHIERLSEEEQELLYNETVQTKNDKLSTEAEKIVEDSFYSVLAYKVPKNEEEKQVETFYDPGLSANLVPIDSIVFMIGTMCEYDDEGNYVDQDHEKIKESELRSFAQQMEEELQGKLGDIPIRVLSD